MLDLVIPDSGPLITLGTINRLDLLDRFNCGILIADMVEIEIRRGPDTAPDKIAFSRWMANQGNRIQTVDTALGIVWNDLSEEARAKLKRHTPNAGEISIREFTDKIRNTLPADDQVLVLFEEDAVKRMSFGSHVHLIHTYAFLVALEQMQVIASAKQVVDQIRLAGRNLAMDTFERRGQSADGIADWQTDTTLRGQAWGAAPDSSANRGKSAVGRRQDAADLR
jgi:hypothetical protein